MSKHIKTTIIINANRETVWNVLTDFEKYSEWNPFIEEISGEPKVGNRIKVKINGITFKPLILTYIKNSEFKWLGHLWFKGIFDGAHKFSLTDNGDGTTTFEQSENFNGILIKLLSKKLDTDVKNGFIQMNEKLKQRIESNNVL